MTKSTITRERLEKIKSWRETYGTGSNVMLPAEEAEELASMALAAIDSKPFAYIIQDKYERERGVEGHLSRSHVSKYVSQEDINEHEITCIPLYRHAQPVPVVSADLLHTAASAIEDLLTNKDRTGAGVWFDLPFRLRSAANEQPAPVELANIALPHSWLDGEGVEVMSANEVKRACRAAMLQAGNSPAQSGCCPAQNSVVPAQSGSSPAIPDGYVLVPKEATKEILDEFDSIIDYGAEDSVDAWHRLLAAATQEVKP